MGLLIETRDRGGYYEIVRERQNDEGNWRWETIAVVGGDCSFEDHELTEMTAVMADALKKRERGL